MKLLCFAKSRGEAASTRQRALGLIDVAKNAGWETEFHWVPAYPRWKFAPVRIVRLWKYMRSLRKADAQTVVLLQRTLRCPEFLWLVRRLRPTLRYVIADFDDAVWLHSPNHFGQLLELSDERWCGSQKIYNHITAIGYSATFVPTLINTSIFSCPRTAENPPVIGWVGDGGAHLKNLAFFADILRNCIDKLPSFRLRLIGVGPYRKTIEDMFAFMKDRVDCIEWVKPADIPAVESVFSIGIMPLLPDAFNEGKSGLKLLEYLAAGVPVVASDLGENAYIVQQPLHGYVVRTKEEWCEAFNTLLLDSARGIEMGEKGRIFARTHYDRTIVYESHLRRLQNLLS